MGGAIRGGFLRDLGLAEGGGSGGGGQIDHGVFGVLLELVGDRGGVVEGVLGFDKIGVECQRGLLVSLLLGFGLLPRSFYLRLRVKTRFLALTFPGIFPYLVTIFCFLNNLFLFFFHLLLLHILLIMPLLLLFLLSSHHLVTTFIFSFLLHMYLSLVVLDQCVHVEVHIHQEVVLLQPLYLIRQRTLPVLRLI